MIEDGGVVDGIECSKQSLVSDGRGEGRCCCVADEYEGGRGVGHVIGL